MAYEDLPGNFLTRYIQQVRLSPTWNEFALNPCNIPILYEGVQPSVEAHVVHKNDTNDGWKVRIQSGEEKAQIHFNPLKQRVVVVEYDAATYKTIAIPYSVLFPKDLTPLPHVNAEADRPETEEIIRMKHRMDLDEDHFHMFGMDDDGRNAESKTEAAQCKARACYKCSDSAAFYYCSPLKGRRWYCMKHMRARTPAVLQVAKGLPVFCINLDAWQEEINDWKPAAYIDMAQRPLLSMLCIPTMDDELQ